jgi:hypothetical protein
MKTEYIRQFIRKLDVCLAEDRFVRLILSHPARAEGAIKKVTGRLVELNGVPQLSFTFHHDTKDITKNMALKKSVEWVRRQLGNEFHSALLATTSRDWQLFAPSNGEPRLVSHKSSVQQAPPRTHDRAKETLLDESARDWLKGLGVMDANSQVCPSMSDKHRQIHRYLEILSHLARDCGWSGAPVSDPVRTQNGDEPGLKPTLQFVDMGCGKGYLTFGAWHLFGRVQQWPIHMIGVETRGELVNAANELATTIHAEVNVRQELDPI